MRASIREAFGVGLCVGLLLMLLIALLAPDDSAQQLWEKDSKIEDQARTINELSSAYMEALGRAAVCRVEPINKREVVVED